MTTAGFVIRQQASKHPSENLWDWSLWVEPQGGALLEAVNRVVYSLHPAFPSPNRIVRDRASGFRLDVQSGTRLGDTWGTFPVRVRLVFGDGRFERQEVRLDLRDDEGRLARGLLELPENPSLDDHLALARALKSKGAFGYAREVLRQARTHPDYGRDERRGAEGSPQARSFVGEGAPRSNQTEELLQQEALCTYKDPLLPLDTRLADALKLLGGCGDGLAATRDPETLGLAGAIYKRIWEVDGQRQHLEQAFRYYRRGYDAMISPEGQRRADYDRGAYTGVNAAFVGDLLRAEELPGADGATKVSGRASEAMGIRRALVAGLQEHGLTRWWHYASLAEARLGLAPEAPEEYERAAETLRLGVANTQADDWARESTASQLTALVDVQTRLYGTDVVRRGWSVIAELVPDNRAALHRPVRGKIGLALSGGGFRAALFHIGVLARLAELDLLREIEVLSCVSGGSIIGAHYYLELRHLLQTKTDADIDREDYLRIVRNLEEHFLAGVQRNVRMRMVASVTANWAMLFRPRSYSRTRRTGELYEECIFNRVKDGDESHHRWLNDLFINPRIDKQGSDADRLDDGFSPKLHNWRRRAKAPILVLNATALNTGRNWQFTASSMGESMSYGTGIDATERLETVYYSEAPQGHREIRLGHAVAASSCVPSLFDPLVLEGLYEDRVVRLVDGGVHDNQGTRALLDHDCTVLLVSDASGQMPTEADPSNSWLGVVLRTNEVQQARIRVAEHQETDSRRRSRLLREEMFVHLRQELEAPSVPPRGEHAVTGGAAPVATTAERTSYGIRRDVQEALALVRTDLDSFTDREAYALMTSGYRTTERALGNLAMFATLRDARGPWRFTAIEPAMRGEQGASIDPQSLLEHLRVSRKRAFKVWSLHPALRVLRWGLPVIIVGLVLWRAAVQPTFPVTYEVNLPQLLIAAGLIVLGFFSRAAGRAADLVRRWIDYRSTLKRMAVGLAMGTVGFLLAWIHIGVFDRWFIALGRVHAPPAVAEPLAPGPSADERAICETRVGHAV